MMSAQVSHSEVLFENTVAASTLYNEIVMTKVCEVQS